MPIRFAVEEDHKDILSISKQSKHTKDFSNIMFSSKENYARKEISVYTLRGRIVAFSNYRHLKRSPVTTLYFIGVSKGSQRKGIGAKFLLWTIQNSPFKKVRFKVSTNNPEAEQFYFNMGAKKVGSGTFKSKEEYNVYELGI